MKAGRAIKRKVFEAALCGARLVEVQVSICKDCELRPVRPGFTVCVECLGPKVNAIFDGVSEAVAKRMRAEDRRREREAWKP